MSIQSPRRIERRLVGAVLVASTAAVLGAGVATGALLRAPSEVDACAPPAGVTVDGRHVLLCEDLEHGRITGAQYRAAIGVESPIAEAPVKSTQWAARVLGVSTQYSEGQWSAQQVLGAPDVYPAAGDNVKAWASLGADDRDEWIEVGYARPVHASAVEIYETYNPGAVDTVQLVTASGQRIELPAVEAIDQLQAGSRKTVVAMPCTAEPIVAVRVHLASQRVPGWNELDAIGLVPCA